MPTNQRRGGFWGGVGNVARGAGRRIGSAIRNSPGGHLVHGEFREAFGATPIGMLVEALRSRGQNPSDLGAFGPMANNYMPQAGFEVQDPTPRFGSDATTDWAQQATPASTQPGYGPNSSRAMGTGAFSHGYGATGANLMGMMGAGAQLRQSGDSGLGRQRPQQN